jgi:hypothetical protein
LAPSTGRSHKLLEDGLLLNAARIFEDEVELLLPTEDELAICLFDSPKNRAD